MEKITDINIKSFRTLRNLPISNMDNLCALIGKNDVGKTSILCALNYLNNNTKSEYDEFVKMEIDLSIKCSNGKSYDRKDGIISVLRPLNYYFFEAQRNESGVDSMTISDLINKKNDLTDIVEELDELKKQIEDIISIYTCVFYLEDFLQNNPEIKRIFDDAFVGKFGCNLQKLLVKKEFIYSYLKNHNISDNDQKLLTDLFNIIDKFEIKKIYYENDLQFVDEQIKKEIEIFFETGSTDSILKIKVDSVKPNHKWDSMETYNTEWFKSLQDSIKKTYYYGSSTLGISDKFFVNYFGANENKVNLSTLLQDCYYLETKQDPKLIEKLLNDSFNKYIIRKKDSLIIDVWKDFLLKFDSKDPIGHRGVGIRRLCYIFNYMVDEYRNYGDSYQPTVFAIDEVENSLHPSLQRELMCILKKVSKYFQIILTSHSPYIVNELEEENIIMLKKDEHDNTIVESLSNRVLNYSSLAEINYIAFGEPSVAYHQELYCYMQNKLNLKVKPLNRWLDSWLTSNGNSLRYDWYDVDELDKTLPTYSGGRVPDTNKLPERATLPYCVRNCIDHSIKGKTYPSYPNAVSSNSVYSSIDKILESIEIMRKAIKGNPNIFV